MIKAVMLFDPSRVSSGDEEAAQEAKLVYYYPSESTEMFDRRTQASLLEGVLGFASFVSDGKKQRCFMETSNCRFVVCEIETSIFLAIVFSIDETACESVFDQFADLLFLLHGRVRDLIDRDFIEVLDDYVPAFVSRRFSQYFEGIKYAPVERHAMLSVHSLGLEIQSELGGISNFAILYEGFLVSTSVSAEVLAPLFNYLATSFGRIGTPAILPGGGSSSFGRSNAMDKATGFLFGPTGQGEGVFCPIVYLRERENCGYLCVFKLEGGLTFVFILNSVSNFNYFRRIEKILTDNNEINFEILPLLRKDVAHQSTNSSSVSFRFRNSVNKSVMTEAKKTSVTWNLFGKSPPLVPSTVLNVMPANVEELAVKPASKEGWTIMKRSNNREIRAEFSDPKMPLWKANEAMNDLLADKFSSVFI